MDCFVLLSFHPAHRHLPFGQRKTEQKGHGALAPKLGSFCPDTPPESVRIAMAGLLTCGSKPSPSFPSQSPVDLSGALSAHSCGGSHGFGASWLLRTVFPISPSGLRRLGPSGTNEHISYPIGKFRIVPGDEVRHPKNIHSNLTLGFASDAPLIQFEMEENHFNANPACLGQRFAKSGTGTAWARTTQTLCLMPCLETPVGAAETRRIGMQERPSKVF